MEIWLLWFGVLYMINLCPPNFKSLTGKVEAIKNQGKHYTFLDFFVKTTDVIH